MVAASVLVVVSRTWDVEVTLISSVEAPTFSVGLRLLLRPVSMMTPWTTVLAKPCALTVSV